MVPLLESTNGSLQGMPLQGAPLRGAPLRGAPPGPGPLELEGKKFGGKSVSETTLFFLKKKNHVFRDITYQNALKLI